MSVEITRRSGDLLIRDVMFGVSGRLLRRMRVRGLLIPRLGSESSKPTRSRRSGSTSQIVWGRGLHHVKLIDLPLLRHDDRNLLSVDTKSLDSEAELKRFFGAKVVSIASSRA